MGESTTRASSAAAVHLYLLARRLTVLVLAVSAAGSLARARPEVIREGLSYYSDDFSVQGGVRDLVGEKNYEEVYQHFTYYEAIYNAQRRVAVFKEYRRGEVLREDRYRYDEKGALVRHTVSEPGVPERAVPIGAAPTTFFADPFRSAVCGLPPFSLDRGKTRA